MVTLIMGLICWPVAYGFFEALHLVPEMGLIELIIKVLCSWVAVVVVMLLRCLWDDLVIGRLKKAEHK